MLQLTHIWNLHVCVQGAYLRCLHAIITNHSHVQLGIPAPGLAHLALQALSSACRQAQADPDGAQQGRRDLALVVVHGLILLGDLLKGSAVGRSAPPPGLCAEAHAAMALVLEYQGRKAGLLRNGMLDQVRAGSLKCAMAVIAWKCAGE